MQPNPVALNQLKGASKSTNHYARLVSLDNQRLWEFIYSPEEKSFSRRSNYAEAPTGAGSVPAQNYLYTSGKTLTLSNLLMDTYCEGKSLRQSLQDLEGLLVVDVKKGLQPYMLYFVWGTEKFGPCVLTDISWKETSWLGGEPAAARLDMSLLEVPLPDSQPKQSNPIPSSTINLTDRQREDGRKKAQEWLNSNLSKLSPTTKQAVQSKSFKWLTDSTGVIKITNSKGETLGTVGTWNGTTFTTTNNTLANVSGR